MLAGAPRRRDQDARAASSLARRLPSLVDVLLFRPLQAGRRPMIEASTDEDRRRELYERLAAAMRQVSTIDRLWTDADQRRRRGLYRHLQAELVRRNRRLLAERQRWPAGALAMCEHLDARHAGWTVHWRQYLNVPGFYHPPGFIAWRRRSGYVCGADPIRLYQAMRAAPDERHWHYHSQCCALVRASEGADVLVIAAALGYDV